MREQLTSPPASSWLPTLVGAPNLSSFHGRLHFHYAPTPSNFDVEAKNLSISRETHQQHRKGDDVNDKKTFTHEQKFRKSRYDPLSYPTCLCGGPGLATAGSCRLPTPRFPTASVSQLSATLSVNALCRRISQSTRNFFSAPVLSASLLDFSSPFLPPRLTLQYLTAN